MTQDQGEQRRHAELTAADFDDELLVLAREVLQRAGYTVAGFSEGAVPMLIAENPDNVLIVAATVTVAAIVHAEPVLSRMLVQRMGEHDLDIKRWDGYAVLLTGQAASVTTTDSLFGIAYNLRHLRRLVKLGVEPTLAAVERALRPVMPLPVPPDGDELSDPLAMLRGRLLERGVDEGAVDSSLERFRMATPNTAVQDDDDDLAEEPDSP